LLEIRPDIAIGLTWTCPQTEGVAAVIVEDGQRVTALSVGQGEVALEVHLPKLIGSLSLEALPGLGMATRARFNQVATDQDLVDSARRGKPSMACIGEASEQLASTPGGMLAAQLEDWLLLLRAELSRAQMRASGLIDQSGLAALGESPQPLVTALATKAEATAQASDIRSGHAG
jgi:hypothetical protein